MRTAPGLMYFEKCAIAWNIGFTSMVSVVPSQMIGAPQKLSTWFGPPISSSTRLQSIQ